MVKRLVILAGVWIGITASPVWACGILEHALPPVGSVIHQSPSQITVSFSQSSIPQGSSLSIRDAEHRLVSAEPVVFSHENSELSLMLKAPLMPGKYSVRWAILWKDCGSETQGTYKFTVAPS